jgi:hypothetical protein
MPAEPEPAGWPWIESALPSVASPDMAAAFRTCFGAPSGRIVLDQLCRLFLHRRVAPSGSDAELRHVEGQRSVVAWIVAMAAPPGSAEMSSSPPADRWIDS